MEFGLIGNPLTHSFSPEIHRRIGDYRYELRELTPEELVPFFRQRDFRGVNVTIPYKQAVIPLVDELTDRARRIGAVNTVVNRNGHLLGDNTDHAGLTDLLQSAGIRPEGRKVLIAGTGGTSKTARSVLSDLGAAEVLTVSRTPGKGDITYGQALSDHRDAAIIVNTTPVGMFPRDEETPLDPACFPGLTGVADAVYHPLRTALVLRAREMGVPAVGGLRMLVAQAVHAAALFTGQVFGTGTIDRVLREITAEKENIVLIGMPTCGKTTVGHLLAAQLDRPFLDTDEKIAEALGEPVPDYLQRNGEAAFRAVESRVVAEISRETGAVIATGGGVPLRAENVRALKRNGRIVFLDRSPELLIPSPDRPLSRDRESLNRLNEQRAGIYAAAADLRVNGDGTPAEVASEIRKETEGEP